MNKKGSSGKVFPLVIISVLAVLTVLIQNSSRVFQFRNEIVRNDISAYTITSTTSFSIPVKTTTPFQPLPTSTVTLTPTVTLTSTSTITPSPSPTSTPTATNTATVTNTPTQAIPQFAFIEGFIGQTQQFSLDCEARSAVDLAAYFGVQIDELEFLALLPKSDDPNEGFVGDLNDWRGQIPPASYGVYANPVAQLLRSYGLSATARQWMTADELRLEIAAGRPVMVWVVGAVEPGIPLAYTPSNGNQTTVASNEHTVVVIGYDSEVVYVIDPTFNQFYMRTWERFIESWEVLNNMAVVVEEPG